MADNTKLSTVQGEKRNTTAGYIADIETTRSDLEGFVKIFVRGVLFEMARTTIRSSEFLWKLIQDKPNSNDGFYHIDRDPEKFKCLMDYLVENRVPDILPCSGRNLYQESLFYGIELPENDCWGTTLLYTVNYINTYNIRGRLKSFADAHGIFGSVEWKQRVSLNIKFHCIRTMDLKIVKEYMSDQMAKQIFMIKSLNENDERRPPPCPLFQCPKTYKQDRSSKSPLTTPSSTPSSSDSCSESAKDLLKQLTVEDVKNWLQQTMFHYLAETWFTLRVNGKDLLEISQTGNLRNGTFMLSGCDLVRFKDILNRFGCELELE